MPKFLINAESDGGTAEFIEEFRDEHRAREVMGKRGWRVASIRIATDADILARDQKAIERQKLKDEDACAYAVQTGDWSNVPLNKISKAAERIVLTTAFTVANAEVQKEIAIVTAECSYGMNLFRDFFVDVRDVFGGRSAAVQNVLRDARTTVLGELKREALMVQADAVIGVDLSYQELATGKMLLLVASGTAVKLKSRGGQE